MMKDRPAREGTCCGFDIRGQPSVLYLGIFLFAGVLMSLIATALLPIEAATECPHEVAPGVVCSVADVHRVIKVKCPAGYTCEVAA